MNAHIKHKRACKKWLVDNGYADNTQELNNVEVADDGKVYFSMFHWIATHIHIDNFMD